MKPNEKLMDLWTRAAHVYHLELGGSPAEEYLGGRGLLDAAPQFLLGYVAEPEPGHDHRFSGMLSIPYITPAGVVGFKFRRLTEGSPRYQSPTGQRHHLFNAQAIIEAFDHILIVEGELDAIAATVAGFPAVAVPGVNGWKPHFRRCFDGIERVLVMCDNDLKEDGSNPGQELAKKLTEMLPDAVRVSLPLGEDVNSTLVNQGAQYLADLVRAIE
jgi:DNA primase